MILTPTLWRTCRVLGSPTRLRLLRHIVRLDRACVQQLGDLESLSEPRASQELRRLQARGLVRAERDGRYVFYRPSPDPKVPSARPILEAAKLALENHPDDETVRLAWAFGNQRRLDILHALQTGPCDYEILNMRVDMSINTMSRHMQILADNGLVVRQDKIWRLGKVTHPLTKAMLKLIKAKEA